MTFRILATVTIVLLVAMASPATSALDGLRPSNPQIRTVSPIKTSIRRDGDRATMIVLFSYKRIQTGYVGNADRPQAFYYTSTRAQIEFDCREHRSRIVRTIFFSDRMGRGNLVHEQNASSGWMHDDDHDRQSSLSFVACESAPDK